MEKLRTWSFPVALVTVWMAVAGYVLAALVTPPAMKTFFAPEVVIKVGAPGRAA
jgi:hypothetical protein